MGKLAHRPKLKPQDKKGAVCYYRVSTQEQLANMSISVQQGTCQRYCQQHGLSVLLEVEEAASAKNVEDRPEFQKLLEYCAKHRDQVRALVVYAASRFSRSMRDFTAVREKLASMGISLYSATEGFDDSPSGIMQANLMGVLAQWDNDVRSERTRVGMTASMRSGNFCYCAPIGYLNARVPGNLTPDPQRAPLIAAAFQWAHDGYAKSTILTKLRDAGLTGPKNGLPISDATLDKFLRNPVYAGYIVNDGWGIHEKGRFQPIVSPELFESVQERLGGSHSHERQLRSAHSPELPLKMFLRCAGCDVPLTGSFSTGRKGRKYPYYHCRTKGCREAKFRRDDLHRMFIEMLYRLSPRGQHVALFQRILQQVWKEKNSQQEETRARLIQQKEGIETRRQKLLDKYLDGKISDSDYERENARFGTALEQAEKALSEAPAGMAEIGHLLEFSEWLLGRVAGIWNAAELSDKLRLQDAMFPNGITVSKAGFGTAQHPYFLDTSYAGLADSKEWYAREDSNL